MKVGSLVFVKSPTFLGWAIRLVSTGKFGQDVPNHVAVVSMVTPFEVILVEASYTGVRIVPMKIYERCDIWVRVIKDPKDVKEGLKWAHDQLFKQRKYDFTAIGGILLRSFWRLFGKGVYSRVRKVRNFLNSRQRFFCSEFSYIYMEKATNRRPWNTPSNITTPYDLFRSEELKDL